MALMDKDNYVKHYCPMSLMSGNMNPCLGKSCAAWINLYIHDEGDDIITETIFAEMNESKKYKYLGGVCGMINKLR